MARTIRARAPKTTLVLGGGWVNTELRSLRDPRVFDYFDYITLDDGERPLLNILTQAGRPRRAAGAHLRAQGRRTSSSKTTSSQHDFPQKDTGIPTYDGLPLDQYVSRHGNAEPDAPLLVGRPLEQDHAGARLLLEEVFVLRRLARLHRPLRQARHRLILQRIRALVEETGETGFHLVDEAAPPAGMRALAKRLIAEKLSITWWGNIRFEKTFTPELCRLLAEAGCVAVSGGLEVASDRLLTLMKKGVTVEQVARVTRAFTDAGIMVHAYLMYGFPTETDAGHRRRARARAPAVRRRLHPVRLLASLRRHRALAHRPASRAIRHHAASAAEHHALRTTTSSSTIPPARITISWARDCARHSITTCTASASIPTCASGSSRARAGVAVAAIMDVAATLTSFRAPPCRRT